MSITSNIDAKEHIAIGLALQSLRQEDVMVVASGSSFHNFGYIGAKGEKKEQGVEHSRIWNEWLGESLSSTDLEDRKLRLQTWEQSSSSALECHPTGKQEHLIPLHVVLGASGCS